jgi:hypothetical protein
MNATTPEMQFPGTATPAASAGIQGTMPTAQPPAARGLASLTGKAGCGCSGSAAAVTAVAQPITGMAGSAPALRPAPGAGGGVSAWVNDKRINALWSINENRNSWAGVTDVGWVKLADNSDSAIVALTMLCGHARVMQSPVYVRQESDGMMREIYVW